MFNVDATIAAQYIYLEARRLHRRRLAMINTAPIGSFYTVRRTNAVVIKCTANGDSLGYVEALNEHGVKNKYLLEDLTQAAPLGWEAVYRLIKQLEVYTKSSVLTKGKPENKPENKSDGSTASYYQLPENCKELQDLISHRNMNAQMGEIFRATYRFGMASHSDQLRDAKKIKFYIEAEIKRLEAQ